MINKCFAHKFGCYDILLKADLLKMISFFTESKIQTLTNKCISKLFDYDRKLFQNNESFYLFVEVSYQNDPNKFPF